LVGCALRRKELSTLTLEDIQLREGRWVIADLVGKGGRVRTVAIPVWVKNAINTWQRTAEIEAGRLLRPLSKSGHILGKSWAIGQSGVWLRPPRKRSGSSTLERMICGGAARSSAERMAATWSKSNFCLDTTPFKRRNDILVRSRNLSSRLTTILGYNSRRHETELKARWAAAAAATWPLKNSQHIKLHSPDKTGLMYRSEPVFHLETSMVYLSHRKPGAIRSRRTW
jgi:hypothetical protein